MSATTKIEWTDATVNPIRARNIETGAVGHFCEKVSPGCTNCYASTWNTRVRPIATKNGGHLIGTGLAYDVRNKPKVEHFLDEKRLADVLKRKEPTKWFWCDMTDLFGEWVPDEWIDRCFAVMALTPQHTHQVLTKRPERMREYVSDTSIHGMGFQPDVCTRLARALEPLGRDVAPGWVRSFLWPLKNVWLGVSVEDRLRRRRIDDLRATPAAVRFVSFEPLLEDVSDGLDLSGIKWTIWGGESGHGARPCALEWLERGVAVSRRFGAAPFVKQLGAYVVSEERTAPLDCFSVPTRAPAKAPNGERWAWRMGTKHKKGGDINEFPPELQVREFPRTEDTCRV